MQLHETLRRGPCHSRTHAVRSAFARGTTRFGLGRAPLSLVLVCLAACTGSITALSSPSDGEQVPGRGLEPGMGIVGRDGGAASSPMAASGVGAEPSASSAVDCEAGGYESVPAFSYVAKLKTLLVGAPVTSDELSAISGDPGKLRQYVEQWVDQPAAKEKLLDFFQTAFQQSPFAPAELLTQLGIGNGRVGVVPGDGSDVRFALGRMFQESFARTALHIVEAGRPFTEVATTDSFMLTTMMATALAFLDDRVQPDSGSPFYRHLEQVITSKRYTNAPVPRLETLDPASPNFMRFSSPDGSAVPSCAGTDAVLPSADFDDIPIRCLISIFGHHSAQRDADVGPSCSASPPAEDSWLPMSAFTDWHMVKVRKPRQGELATQFFDLVSSYLKTSKPQPELVLHTPRVGYFTTPAFFAVWPTNEDNSARVTLNQTLIVGLGHSLNAPAVAPTSVVEDFSDDQHSAPGTPCYGCHVRLDPLRNFFRKEFSVFGSEQLDPTTRAEPAAFSVGAVKATGETVSDLGRMIASHPDFARAWVQKLCFAANSAECPEQAPEFERIVRLFVDSKYDFRALLIDFYSSPLATGSSCVSGSSADQPSVARRRHFCASLSSRTGLADACGIDALLKSEMRPYTKASAALAHTIPDDEFSRGDAKPVTISENNLFTSGAYESMCEGLAPKMVGTTALLKPARVDEAVGILTETVMALPKGDPRHDEVYALLAEHVQAASAKAGGDVATGLQSAFVLACASPAMTGVGF
jgi:hypothetical protein